MKQIIIILTIFFSLKCYSQNADAIMGKWLKTNKEDLIIEVYNERDEYKGKISWSNDKKKPVGFVILEGFKYNPKSKKWEGGKIHDPNSGSSYTATAKIKSNGTLEVNGYLGFSFLGSKRTFRKVK